MGFPQANGKTWTAIVASFALVAAAFLGLCRSGEEHTPPLRVGINTWPGYEFVHLADQKKLFEATGVPVEVVEFNSLLDARRSFERGQIDGFMATAADVALTLGQTSRSPRIVQVIDYSTGGDVLLIDSSLPDLAAMKGRRIGLEPGTIGSYLLGRALSRTNLTFSDIRQVPGDQQTLLSGWKSGKFDGIVTYPPFSLEILSDGRAKRVFGSDSIPGEIVDVIVFDSAVVGNRRTDVANFLRGFWMARSMAKIDPAGSIPIMARHEGVSDSLFFATLQGTMRLVEASEQSAFLAPGGTMEQILSRSDSFMRIEGSIDGPRRTRGAVDAEFAEIGFKVGDR